MGIEDLSGLLTKLAASHAVGDVLEHTTRDKFVAWCQAHPDIRGVGFEANPSSPGLGSVIITKETSKPHAWACGAFVECLTLALRRLGLGQDVCYCSTPMCTFATGSMKEPDACFYWAGRHETSFSPCLVVEVAVAQTAEDVDAQLHEWVRPGGGSASLGVGLVIPQVEHAWEQARMTAYVYKWQDGRCVRSAALEFGEEHDVCEGDARFFLWLPLDKLLPSPRYTALSHLALAARIAWHGWWAGVLAVFYLGPWRAGCSAWARCRAPWGAMPVDLYPVRSAGVLPYVKADLTLAHNNKQT